MSVFWFTPSETDFDSGHSKNEGFFFPLPFSIFFSKRERRGSSVAAALRHCLSSWSSPEYFTEPHLAAGLPHTPHPLRQGRGAVINRTLLHPQIPQPPSHSPPSFAIITSASQLSTHGSFSLSRWQPVGFRRIFLRSYRFSLVMGLKDACAGVHFPSSSLRSIPAVVHIQESDSSQPVPLALMEGVLLICLSNHHPPSPNLAYFTLCIQSSVFSKLKKHNTCN